MQNHLTVGNSIVQIVPSLPPEVGGVGDYALILSRELETVGQECRYITVTGGEHVDAPVARLGRLRGRSLARDLEGARSVILHHSPYGYARYGLCTYLSRELRRWRAADFSRRLAIIMHEVSATGALSSTAFWAGIVQRGIAYQLAATADFVATTSEATRRQIAARGKAEPVTLAVFSNVGETLVPVRHSQRQIEAVVFGGMRQRNQLYTALAAEPHAADAFAAARVSRIVDIGPPFSGPLGSIAGIPVEPLGVLEPKAVRQTIAGARFGLVDYPRHVMTKSGIIAAYLANGAVCVNVCCTGALPPDLCEGREFLSFDTFSRGDANLDVVAAAGHRWYAGHSASIVAQTVLSGLFQSPSSDVNSPSLTTFTRTATPAAPYSQHGAHTRLA